MSSDSGIFDNDNDDDFTFDPNLLFKNVIDTYDETDCDLKAD